MSTPQDATDLMVAHAALPGAEQVLDLARLCVLLGREVTLDRVRIKPAASVLVSWRGIGSPTQAGERGRALADVGWAMLVASPDKRDGVLRRAGKTGADVTEHSGDSPFLLSGGVDSDPRLGKEAHAVLRRLADGPAPRVLSYNPSRHLVLEVPGTGEVLRVAARPLDDLLEISEQWQHLGIPTTPQRHWKGRPAVLVGEFWGLGDLASMAEDPQATAAAAALGTAIARLHGAELSPQPAAELPAARIGGRVPCTTEVLDELLPQRAEQVRELAMRLDQLLPVEQDDAHCLIHGDLSPDQVLLGPDTHDSSEGIEIRVVDLDRSGLGPRGADLGSWIASCLSTGTDHLTAPFLNAYAEHLALPEPVELAAWTARALLGAALDPMRRHHQHWPTQVQHRLDLAHRLLDAATDEALPALARTLGAHPGATVVSHRAGKRAVLRTHDRDGQVLYVKVANKGRTRRALGAIERAAAFDGPFRTPQVVAAKDESLTFAALSGTPLHEGLPTADGSWRRAWRITMDAWAQAVRTSRTALPEGPLHGAAEEIAVLEKWHERASHVDPDGAEHRDRAVQISRELLAGLPALDRPALIHRDLHDKQILWDRATDSGEGQGRKADQDRRPGLLDVDTACLGDPALDAGNLRAHATWRELQGQWTPEQAAQVRAEIDRVCLGEGIDDAGDDQAGLGVDPAALAAYETATLARLTCLYALRPRWRAAATDLARTLRSASPTPLGRSSAS